MKACRKPWIESLRASKRALLLASLLGSCLGVVPATSDAQARSSSAASLAELLAHRPTDNQVEILKSWGRQIFDHIRDDPAALIIQSMPQIVVMSKDSSVEGRRDARIILQQILVRRPQDSIEPEIRELLIASIPELVPRLRDSDRNVRIDYLSLLRNITSAIPISSDALCISLLNILREPESMEPELWEGVPVASGPMAMAVFMNLTPGPEGEGESDIVEFLERTKTHVVTRIQVIGEIVSAHNELPAYTHILLESLQSSSASLQLTTVKALPGLKMSLEDHSMAINTLRMLAENPATDPAVRVASSDSLSQLDPSL